jgi:hypothetical protein
VQVKHLFGIFCCQLSMHQLTFIGTKSRLSIGNQVYSTSNLHPFSSSKSSQRQSKQRVFGESMRLEKGCSQRIKPLASSPGMKSLPVLIEVYLLTLKIISKPLVLLLDLREPPLSLERAQRLPPSCTTHMLMSQHTAAFAPAVPASQSYSLQPSPMT